MKDTPTMHPDSYFIDPITRDYRSTCPTANGRNLDQWDATLANAKARNVLKRWLKRHPASPPNATPTSAIIVHAALGDVPSKVVVVNGAAPVVVALQQMLKAAITADPRPLERAARVYWLDMRGAQPQAHQARLVHIEMMSDANPTDADRWCTVSLESPAVVFPEIGIDVTTYPDDVYDLAVRMNATWVKPVHLTAADTEDMIAAALPSMCGWATCKAAADEPGDPIDGARPRWEFILTEGESGRETTVNHEVVIDGMRRLVENRRKVRLAESIIDTYAEIISATDEDSAANALVQLDPTDLDALFQYIALGECVYG